MVAERKGETTETDGQQNNDKEVHNSHRYSNNTAVRIKGKLFYILALHITNFNVKAKDVQHL